MKPATAIFLFVLTFALVALAQSTQSLQDRFALSHCRFEILSPGIRTLVVGSNVDFQKKISVYVIGEGLTYEILEQLGADRIIPMTEAGHFLVESSLNTVLNISAHPTVSFIQNVTETN